MFGAVKGPMKIWYLYVVRCGDDTLYTGITTDLKRRLNEHNTSKRGAKYTKTRRPINLVYYELHQSRSNAQKAEHKFKKLTRQQKEKIIII
jgi:putative endonuclease